MVGVAQLVRAPVCGTGGRGFNPLRPPHSMRKKNTPNFSKKYVFLLVHLSIMKLC